MHFILLHRVTSNPWTKLDKLGQAKWTISFHMLRIHMHSGLVILHQGRFNHSVETWEICSQCENYENLLSLFFGKNFVKITFLLKKLLKSLFDEKNILMIVNFSFFREMTYNLSPFLAKLCEINAFSTLQFICCFLVLGRFQNLRFRFDPWKMIRFRFWSISRNWTFFDFDSNRF